MAKVHNCGLEINKFVLNSFYYTHRKGMNSLILPTMVYIGPLLFFYKYDFGIK